MIRKLCGVVTGLLLACIAFADDKPQDSKKSDEVKPAVTTAKPDAPKQDPGRASPSKDADLLRALEKQLAPIEDEEHPLERVGRRMRDVQGRLVKTDAGDETREIQVEIVKDLDKLIEEMKKGGT